MNGIFVTGLFALSVVSIRADNTSSLPPVASSSDQIDEKWRLGIHREERILIGELEEMSANDPQVTIYTIGTQEDGWWFLDGKEEGVNIFRRFPIFGKADVSDKNDRHALIDAVIRGINEWKNGGIPQFGPTRALTIATKYKKMDILLSFTSSAGEVWGSYGSTSFATSGSPSKEFNRVVAKYKLPISMPNHSPDPAPTSVTPAAGQPARQP